MIPPPPEDAACLPTAGFVGSVDSERVPGAEPNRAGESTDDGSFTGFYLSRLAPLRRYLARLLGNGTAAQDVAQDAFVKVHAVMSERPLEQPQAYLYITARRLAIDELRRRRADPLHRQYSEALDDVLSESPGVERVVMARSELEHLLREIDTLPPGCRTVFLLSRMENLTHQQIADRLGTSPSTVEKQHARALRLLRQMQRETPASAVRPETPPAAS